MIKFVEVFIFLYRFWFIGKGERVKLFCLLLVIKIIDIIYYCLMYFLFVEKDLKIIKFVIFFCKKVIFIFFLIGFRFVSRKFMIKIFVNWEVRVLVYFLILIVV